MYSDGVVPMQRMMWEYSKRSRRTVSLLTGLFILILGTVGNVLVALTLSVALWRGWRSPQPTSGPQSMVAPASGTGVLLLVVCFMDLLCLYLDLLHALIYIDLAWDMFATSDTVCGALNVIRYSLEVTSSWLLVTLWVQHLALRRWPSLGRRICSKRAAGIISSLAVILSLAFSAPMGQFFRLTDSTTRFDYFYNKHLQGRYFCQFMIEDSDNHVLIINVFFLLDIVIYSLLPGALVIVNVIVILVGRCKARQKVLAGLDRRSTAVQARFQEEEGNGNVEDDDAPTAIVVRTSVADSDRSPLVSLGDRGEGWCGRQGSSSRGQEQRIAESVLPCRREAESSDPQLERRSGLDGETSTATVHTGPDAAHDATSACEKESSEQKGLTGMLLVLSLLYVIFIFGYDGVCMFLNGNAYPAIEPSVYNATKLFVYLAQWTPFRDQFLNLCRACCCCCCRFNRRSTNSS